MKKVIIFTIVLTVIGVICISIGSALLCQSIRDRAIEAYIQEYETAANETYDDEHTYTIEGEDGHTYKITNKIIGSKVID